MKSTNIKIDIDKLNGLKLDCLDYDYKNDEGNLRERYIFMGLPEKKGFTLVECSSNGKFVCYEDASLSQAIRFLQGSY